MAYKFAELAIPVNIAEYMRRNEKVKNTPARVTAQGSFRLVNGQWITERDFLKQNPPVKLYRNEFTKTLIGCVQ